MRHVEVRRHTITSTVPRAFETAVAMGLDVDEQLEQLNPFVGNAEISWPASFAEFARVISQGGATARFAEAQARLWRSIVQRLPDDRQALIITHGGVVEAGAVACVPDADHCAWGEYCDYCEGVGLAFDGQRFTQASVLRVNLAV